MKIAIDARPARWYRGTGIGNYTHQLVRHLLLWAPEHRYCLLWPDDDTDGLPVDYSVNVHIIPKSDNDADLVCRWLLAEQADVYHVPQNGVGLPDGCPVPCVATIHDLIPFLLPEQVRSSFLMNFTRQVPRAGLGADHILTVSHSAKADITRILGIPSSQVTVSYPAPDILYRPVHRAQAQERIAHKFGLVEPYILYVGGLTRRKNLDTLIFAYSHIARILPQYQQLVLPGNLDRNARQLQALAESLGVAEDVVFPGFVPLHDMPSLYCAADLFVYPSLYEGFGVPPLEAMACGTPVIASSASALPEVVGNAGLLFSPLDGLSMMNAILNVLSDPVLAEELRLRGFCQATRFSWKDTVRETLKAYHLAIEHRHSRHSEELVWNH